MLCRKAPQVSLRLVLRYAVFLKIKESTDQNLNSSVLIPNERFSPTSKFSNPSCFLVSFVGKKAPSRPQPNGRRLKPNHIRVYSRPCFVSTILKCRHFMLRRRSPQVSLRSVPRYAVSKKHTTQSYQCNRSAKKAQPSAYSLTNSQTSSPSSQQPSPSPTLPSSTSSQLYRQGFP